MLESLANAGPALTRSLGLFATYPFPTDNIGEVAAGRLRQPDRRHRPDPEPLDASFLTGTRWEGNLTELELQWGRTIGQLPSPYTGRQSACRALPLGPGTLTCHPDACESASS